MIFASTDICDPGWSYFNGYCYFTSGTCTNWTTALTKCQQENSVLVDVNNNEENVYIQHRHNGEKSWLGLNDKSTEGDFTWADRGHGNFTAWAKNQPNNFKEEDCVHALGVKLVPYIVPQVSPVLRPAIILGGRLRRFCMHSHRASLHPGA